MYIRKVKGVNQCLKCTTHNAIVKLSDVQFGTYEFVMVCCDNTLEHRLLEMGFIPGTEVFVINNNGLGRNIIIKIRETRIAFNYNVAKKILVKSK
jgi:Fe2+ transport system protein FeoA